MTRVGKRDCLLSGWLCHNRFDSYIRRRQYRPNGLRIPGFQPGDSGSSPDIVKSNMAQWLARLPHKQETSVRFLVLLVGTML